MTHADKEDLIKSIAFDLIDRIQESEILSAEAKTLAESCVYRYVDKYTRTPDYKKDLGHIV